jgi:hypothetical protein
MVQSTIDPDRRTSPQDEYQASSGKARKGAKIEVL